MRKILTILMLLGVLMLVAACGTTPQQPAPSTTEKEIVSSAPTAAESTSAPAVSISGQTYPVVIESFKFMPTDLQVKAGDTVEWTNKDSAEHTLTFENGNFDQKLPAGGKAIFTFNEKGEFRYFCSFHPEMQGVVVVS